MTTTQTLTTEAFAKVNLTLEVFGTRADGFHALRSLVLPVTLADTVTVELADEISSDSPYPDDLCVKAARALRKVVSSCRRAGEPELPGVRIHVDKRIPAGGGLGGGSADAAATLWLLNDLWGLSLGIETLAAIGSRPSRNLPPALVIPPCRFSMLKPISFSPNTSTASFVVHSPVLSSGNSSIIVQFRSLSIALLTFSAFCDERRSIHLNTKLTISFGMEDLSKLC